MDNLESKLEIIQDLNKINEGDVDLLAEYCLIASGIIEKNNMETYFKKIEKIYEEIKSSLNDFSDYETANSIHKYFKLNFIFRNGKSLLTDIIDEKEGNCLSLTVLYTIMGLKFNLNIEVLNSQEYHFFNKVICKNNEYFVEHLLGGNIDEYVTVKDFELLEDKSSNQSLIHDDIKSVSYSSLISSSYRNKAKKFVENNDFPKAIECFIKSININPKNNYAKELLKDTKDKQANFLESLKQKEINPSVFKTLFK
jgi:tetratricopeptide (TPR) repeat protein